MNWAVVADRHQWHVVVDLWQMLLQTWSVYLRWSLFAGFIQCVCCITASMSSQFYVQLAARLPLIRCALTSGQLGKNSWPRRPIALTSKCLALALKANGCQIFMGNICSQICHCLHRLLHCTVLASSVPLALFCHSNYHQRRCQRSCPEVPGIVKERSSSISMWHWCVNPA